MAFDYMFGNDGVPRPPTGFDPTGAMSQGRNHGAMGAKTPGSAIPPVQAPRPSGVFDRLAQDYGARPQVLMPQPQMQAPPQQLPQPQMPQGPQGPPKSLEDALMLDAQGTRGGQPLPRIV